MTISASRTVIPILGCFAGGNLTSRKRTAITLVYSKQSAVSSQQSVQALQGERRGVSRNAPTGKQ
ncbi:MAG: hypothetical protein F6J93_31395 [Oscillatoria sp. SIO1A7]|nr:hypothetical protein [Oscillatoria sp. SIO1A7]